MTQFNRHLLKGIYAITDDSLLSGNNLQNAVEEALTGGVKLLQYRSKTTDWNRKVDQASALVELCDSYQIPLIINDDIELCLQSAAHGVHLGQKDEDVSVARARLGGDAIIGITCHNCVEKALMAEKAGATYVAFGRFFPSKTKPNAPAATTEVLRTARQEITIPLVAIGGINAQNGTRLIKAGADMLAVIDYLFSGPGVLGRAQALSKLFNEVTIIQ